MKKVKLNQIMASPKGCFPSGSIIELSDSEADYLVSIHQAVLVEEIKLEKREKIADKNPKKETADIKLQPEDLDPNN